MKFFFTLLLLGGLYPTLEAQNFTGLKKINGTKLYFNIKGEGVPIVVVHGGPGMSHDYFQPHFHTLSKKHKVVMYDQRASGKSSLPSVDSIAMDFFVNDLEAIRRDLGVDKINLLGHSWGALLAVNYGIKYPDKVNKLILCNSVPLNRAYDQEMAKLQGSRMTGADSTDRSIIMGSKGFRDGKTEAYRKLLLLSFRHSFHKPHHYKKLKVVLPGNYPQSSKALFTGLGPDLKDYDYYNEIGSLKFPVLVLHGEQDIIPMEAITKIQKQIPATDVVVFNKSGHFLFIEENRKFTSEVTRFLKD